MELNFVEIFQTIVNPLITIIIGIFGWKANAEKNELKIKIEGMKADNESKDIKNRDSWLDHYKKLHDDQAARLSEMESQILDLKKQLFRFENAFKKYHTCAYAPTCPIHMELSKFKARDGKRVQREYIADRQREPP